MNNTVNIMRLENAAQQQLVENFAAAITSIIAESIKMSSTTSEATTRIDEAFREPQEKLQETVIPLINEDMSLADEGTREAFKDALWMNSREFVHETINLLWRQVESESGAE